MLIEQYGWNSHFENQFPTFSEKGLDPGRVTAIHGFNYTVIGKTGSTDAILAGSLLYSKENWQLPKVGDWVAFKEYGGQGIIIDVLHRQNELSRKMPGKANVKQVIAANIDRALIIQGLDRDFNIMRVQRYLQQVSQCNIEPVIILNKKDLVKEPQAFIDKVVGLGYPYTVLAVSALHTQTGTPWTDLQLEPGKTYILVGSSGVGKSTILNALLGYVLQQLGDLSTANSKGKHTTTSRNLVLLENGSMIIDTPGMREFGLTSDADESPSVEHPAIEELSAECRFRNCTHAHEPGCAVIEAMQTEKLPRAVYRSYQKLMREQYHFQTNSIEKKRTERQFGKMAKQVMADRKSRKY